MARQEVADTSFLPLGGDGSSLQDLNLGQYGSATVKARQKEDDSGYCETPDINGTNDERDNNSIANSGFGRDVEDCEIEKSNILLLGPTGSGESSVSLSLIFIGLLYNSPHCISARPVCTQARLFL
jgi:ATP-dependent protease Clp ATPase subunit